MGHSTHSSLDDFDAAAERFEHAYWAVSLGDASTRTADLDAFASALNVAENFFASYLAEQAIQQEQLVEKCELRLDSTSHVPDWEISRKFVESDWRVDSDWRALFGPQPMTLSPLSLTPLSSTSNLLFGTGAGPTCSSGQDGDENNVLLMSPDYFTCESEFDFLSSALETDMMMFVEPAKVTEPVVVAKATEGNNAQGDGGEQDDEFVDIETIEDNDAPVYEVKEGEPMTANGPEDGGVACVPSHDTSRGPKLLLPLPTASPRPHYVIEGDTRAHHLAPNVNMQGVPDSASVSCLPPQQGPPMFFGGKMPHPYMRSLSAAVQSRMLATGRTGKGDHRRRRGELKRLSHNTLEKRRREDLRVVQEALKVTLPWVANQSGASQLDVLSKAVEHLKSLRAENERLLKERQQQLALKQAQERRLRELKEALGLGEADTS